MDPPLNKKGVRKPNCWVSLVRSFAVALKTPPYLKSCLIRMLRHGTRSCTVPDGGCNDVCASPTESRTGAIDNGACCVATSWAPATTSVPIGRTFTQTSNCGDNRRYTKPEDECVTNDSRPDGGNTRAVNRLRRATVAVQQEPVRASCPGRIGGRAVHRLIGDISVQRDQVHLRLPLWKWSRSTIRQTNVAGTVRPLIRDSADVGFYNSDKYSGRKCRPSDR